MNPQNEPEVLLKEILQMMEQCDAVFSSGETADLAEVEMKVKDFCLVVADLSPEDALHFQEDMKGLMERLVEWSDQLIARKQEIEKDLQQLNTQSKAQTAYMTNSIPKEQNNDNKGE